MAHLAEWTRAAELVTFTVVDAVSAAELGRTRRRGGTFSGWTGLFIEACAQTPGARIATRNAKHYDPSLVLGY